jgi:hypothetical protein
MASFKDIFTETNIGLFFLEKPMLQWEVQENCTDKINQSLLKKGKA